MKNFFQKPIDKTRIFVIIMITIIVIDFAEVTDDDKAQ